MAAVNPENYITTAGNYTIQATLSNSAAEIEPISMRAFSNDVELDVTGLDPGTATVAIPDDGRGSRLVRVVARDNLNRTYVLDKTYLYNTIAVSNYYTFIEGADDAVEAGNQRVREDVNLPAAAPQLLVSLSEITDPVNLPSAAASTKIGRIGGNLLFYANMAAHLGARDSATPVFDYAGVPSITIVGGSTEVNITWAKVDGQPESELIITENGVAGAPAGPFTPSMANHLWLAVAINTHTGNCWVYCGVEGTHAINSTTPIGGGNPVTGEDPTFTLPMADIDSLVMDFEFPATGTPAGGGTITDNPYQVLTLTTYVPGTDPDPGINLVTSGFRLPRWHAFGP